MREVSRRSWHYRLYSSVWDVEPKNLCLYFWGTVAAPLMLLTIFVGDAVAGLSDVAKRRIAVIGVSLLLVWMTIALAWAIYQDPWVALIIPAVLLGLAILAVIGVGLSVAFEGRGDEEEQQQRGDSSGRLVWEFLKGKKQKVCPLIKVVD
jgi:hypothetical protein